MVRSDQKTHKTNTTPRKNAEIVAVDVFCGAAGLSLGLKSAGISVVAGIDLDPACRFPFEANVGSEFIQRDIVDLDAKEVRKLFGDAEVRLLAGCAPCQPFSGYTTRRRAIDNRWRLLLEFLRLAQLVKPEIVTMENVPRLRHLAVWQQFVEELKLAGYFVSWDVLDAAQYGVPQRRRRLVLIASRLGPIKLPKPGKTIRSVKDAIGRLSPISAGIKSGSDPLHSSRALTGVNLARIRASKPAGTWREWPLSMRADCHKTESGKTYPSVYGRMSWDQPAPTITTQFYGFGNGRFGHPVQDRALTLREGAMLQSFPRTFQFISPNSKVSFKTIGRLIGNAVPPKLGKAIGKCIVDHVATSSSSLRQ